MSRWGHSVTAISLTPVLTEVTVFGGARLYVPNLPAGDVQTIAATAILTFGELKSNLCPTPQYPLHKEEGLFQNHQTLPLCVRVASQRLYAPSPHNG